MTDIYKAPAADFLPPPPANPSEAIARALAGEFEFALSQMLSEAWRKVHGNKGAIWAAIILYLVVALPIYWVLAFYLDHGLFAKCLRFVVTNSVDMALLTGLVMLGVKLACGINAEPNEVYAYIEYFVKLVLAYIMTTLMILGGFLLLILPGIYLAVAYSLTPLLIVDKKMGLWEAMEASRKAVSHCWFRAFFLFLIFMVILVLSAIPLGIGLIWTIPMALLLHGIAYRNIFGYQHAATPTPIN